MLDARNCASASRRSATKLQVVCPRPVGQWTGWFDSQEAFQYTFPDVLFLQPMLPLQMADARKAGISRHELLHGQGQGLRVVCQRSRRARDRDGIGASRRTASATTATTATRRATSAAGRHEDNARDHHAEQQDT